MLLDLRNGVEEVDVTFYNGAHPIQTLTTGEEGVVLLLRELELGERPPAVRVEASVDERPLVAEAQVFVWRDDRLILLVDIDDTISETDYFDLILTKVDQGSQPIAGSREVLQELAQDYHIVYFTARPRLAIAQTRRWLRTHGYPPGPLYTAPTLSEVTDQTAFKRGFIALIKSCWPNLLLGIGDKSADRDAYTSNELFAVIRGSEGVVEAGETVVVLPDWEAIGGFFRERRSVLADPVGVRADLRVLAPAAGAGGREKTSANE